MTCFIWSRSMRTNSTTNRYNYRTYKYFDTAVAVFSSDCSFFCRLVELLSCSFVDALGGTTSINQRKIFTTTIIILSYYYFC